MRRVDRNLVVVVIGRTSLEQESDQHVQLVFRDWHHSGGSFWASRVLKIVLGIHMG